MMLTAHCTLQTANCQQLVAHWKLHTENCKLQTANFTMQIAHYTLPTACCTLQIAHCTLQTACSTLSTGKSLTFRGTVYEASELIKSHKCSDPLCDTQLLKVRPHCWHVSLSHVVGPLVWHIACEDEATLLTYITVTSARTRTPRPPCLLKPYNCIIGLNVMVISPDRQNQLFRQDRNLCFDWNSLFSWSRKTTGNFKPIMWF